MKTTPRISETEWEIMKVVWRKHPIGGGEVIEALNAETPGWHPKTVRTLLLRLVQKRALKAETEGRAKVFMPLVSEKECIANASESFVNRVFGGFLRPMLAHFVDEQKITKKDLDELRELLEQKTKGKKS
jgi:BlaI family penicillinase repressor